MDFDIKELGDKISGSDKEPFFNNMTFEEWTEKYEGHKFFEQISYLHKKCPKCTYEELVKYCFDATVVMIENGDNYHEAFGRDYPDLPRLYAIQNIMQGMIKDFKKMKKVSSSDEKGHGSVVNFRLGGDVMSVRVESSFRRRIQGLIEHDKIGYHLISDFVRDAFLFYSLFVNMVEDIYDPSFDKFKADINALIDLDLEQRREVELKAVDEYFQSNYRTLVHLLTTNIDRKERLNAFKNKIVDYLNGLLSSIRDPLDKGKVRDFVINNFSLRQILDSLQRENLITDEYVRSISQNGKLPEDVSINVRNELYTKSSKPVDFKDRVCSVCGSNKTYAQRGAPQWYRGYDNGGYFTGDYICKKCHDKGNV